MDVKQRQPRQGEPRIEQEGFSVKLKDRGRAMPNRWLHQTNLCLIRLRLRAATLTTDLDSLMTASRAL